ncbi:recombinase family protein, partial [Enterococcus faecium]
MAKIRYARVSSLDQNLDRQLELLSECDKIFSDKASGKDTNREGFQEMMKFIREGDIVVVTELKRLGRNNKELTETMNLIQLKKATLEVLNLPALTGITDDNLRRLLNNLIIELYKYQAEEERRYIRETQQQGIGMATVFLTNFIRCRTSFRMLFRLSLTMSLLGCDDLRQELTV